MKPGCICALKGMLCVLFKKLHNGNVPWVAGFLPSVVLDIFPCPHSGSSLIILTAVEVCTCGILA